jgi:hypothetical protein
MGISALMVEWFDRLAVMGVFTTRRELMELGPQDLMVTQNVIRDVARRQKTLTDPDLTVDSIARRMAIGGQVTAMFYGIFGIERYLSADKFDPRSDWQIDLNIPANISRRFPLVTNFGTSEHVFNVAQSIATTMDIVAPDGVALFVLPAFGQINHGFYNIHPTLFFDICRENSYEILDYIYCDNFVVRCRKREREGADCPPTDFSTFPIQLADLVLDQAQMREDLARKIALNFAANISDPLTEIFAGDFLPQVSDYSFVAIRKHPHSQPRMKFPSQNVYRLVGTTN